MNRRPCGTQQHLLFGVKSDSFHWVESHQLSPAVKVTQSCQPLDSILRTTSPAGLRTCVRTASEWCRRRAGEGGRGGSRGGGHRVGRDTCQAVETGLRTVRRLENRVEETCGFIGQCSTKRSVKRKSTARWRRTGGGRSRTQKQKICISLFFFVCLSKENFNWNCLIFKRNIRDLFMMWGLCSPLGQVRGGLLGCCHPKPPRHWVRRRLRFSFRVANAVRLSE